MTARRLIGEERGAALIVALGILIVFSVVVAGLASYSSTTSRTAEYSKSRQLARSIAEAGINDALAVLNLPSNNALSTTLLPTRTTNYEGGYATWSGTLNQSTATWTVTSTGRVANPTGGGGAPITKTITVNVAVRPTLSQTLNNQAWNYIYAYRTGTPGGCDMTLQQSVNVASPLYVEGNLCLQNTATISGGPLVVKGKLTLSQTQNRVGASGSPITEARIGNGCQWKNNPTHTPCAGAVDNVFATILNSNPTSISPPTVDWDGWYNAAAPGPKFGCVAAHSSASSTWPIFDNNTVRDKSVTTAWNLTPSTSYDCWTDGGELAWNATTKVLTTNGTVFIDGSAYITNGAVNSYVGQGALYLSGTFFMQSSKLCGLLTSGGTACDTTNWDPNTRALIVVANGNGDNGIPVGDGIQIKSAYFQGGLYATNIVETDTTAQVDGPILGSTVVLGQSVNTNFPFIQFVPTGTPGNPVVYAQPLPPTNYSGG